MGKTRLFGIVLIVVLMLPETFRPQSRPVSSDALGSIEGVVVRLSGNEPITGVDVELTRVGGTADSPLAPPTYPQGSFSPGAIVAATAPNPAEISRVRTKDDGRFTFANLKPGTYRLLAARAGGSFLPGEYGKRDPNGRGVDFPLTQGQAMRNVRLELAASGSIAGRVADEDGNPAVRVRVMALEASYDFSSRRFRIVQAVDTDDRGEYRLFWLPPGKYYIAARPEDLKRQNILLIVNPPGASEPTVETVQQAPLTHRISRSGAVVEETYELAYRTEVVTLDPGAVVNGVDVSLAGSRVPARRVRGIVIDGTSGRPGAGAMVRAIPRIAGPSVITPTVSANSDGAFELVGVGPGEYFVSGSLAGAARGIGLANIGSGNADVDNVKLIATPGFKIPGRILIEGPLSAIKGDDIQILRPTLVPENRLAPTAQGTDGPLPEGSFTIMGTQPGYYRMSIAPILYVPNGGSGSPAKIPAALEKYYVKSIRLGSIDVLNDGLHLGSPPDAEFQIIVGANGGVLEGSVLGRQGVPFANATVLLVPVNTVQVRGDLFRSTPSTASGRFRLSGIPPGDYKLFAWSSIENGRWFDPEFMRGYEGRGILVHIAEGDNPKVDLTVIPEGR